MLGLDEKSFLKLLFGTALMTVAELGGWSDWALALKIMIVGLMLYLGYFVLWFNGNRECLPIVIVV